jgi:hypothetical protein
MKMKFESTMVRIADQKVEPVLSKAQKQFNKLINQIEIQRNILLAWKDAIPSYQQKHAMEFEPLIESLRTIEAEKIRALDSAIHGGSFNKTEKAKMRDLICDFLENVMDPEDTHNLKALYNKYMKANFDEELEDEKASIKAMIEEKLGIELEEDFDMNSPDEVMARLFKKVQQKKEQEELEEQNQPQQAQTKKSAKVLAREEKQKQQEEEVSQSIKDVFRQLVILLHPDKEQDALERARKTALMQRVNQAYKKKDLLQLLELQLEIEQIDQNALNAISADRLKTYNRILTEQLASLNQEVEGVEHGFKLRFMLTDHFSLSPTSLLKDLQRDIAKLKKDIACASIDVAIFQDKGKLKTWLRGYQIRPVDDFWDFPDFSFR